MLTSYGTRADVVRALRAGARGYVLKAGQPGDLFRALRIAAGGGVGVPVEIAAHLVEAVVSDDPVVSDREIEVVRLLGHGRSNRAIADALFLTEATVKTVVTKGDVGWFNVLIMTPFAGAGAPVKAVVESEPY